ncbi:o-succinylbenzoate synthase [Weissella hellenica]|uniref:o-succinylbenzoate synthase n=1 Tax=Weissella hellenica TaxID=46256 RepID=A0A4Y4G1Y3_WEIHE|nr:o-succinylbenzoate synthase [Weissella hellenica]NKY66877.1 o-succinylbenzoate synthase [Weissella hellenica]GED35807.1 o-succinylbenzoate synthase [Weissella hellenica]SCB88605.1 O-succinylbenzoate synthase [Weissella hellenica]
MKIKKIKLYPLVLTLKTPFKTAHGTTSQRPITLVAVQLTTGIVGYGEIQSFADSQYVNETHHQSALMVQKLSKLLIGQTFIRPEDAAEWLAAKTTLSFAKAAIEMAIWDAYGKQTHQSLTTLLGGQSKRVAVSQAIGMQEDWQSTQQLVIEAIAQGYQRIKIKINQATNLQLVADLVKAFPNQMFSLDANAAWTADRLADLQRLDQAGLAIIEQPYATTAWEKHRQTQARLAQLKLSLDESLNDLTDVKRAIDQHTTAALTLKQGKLGGIMQTKKAIQLANQSQVTPWIGGMLGTGLGRTVDLILASLPGANTIPTDSSQFDHYYEADIVDDLPYVKNGYLPVPVNVGIGVTLNWQIIGQCLISEPIVYQ